MSSSDQHKPISEEELKEMESRVERGFSVPPGRLIVEVRRLRGLLYKVREQYPNDDIPALDALDPCEPLEPYENPFCDGVKDGKNYGDTHRCFKDGKWLDDGSEM